MEGRPAPWDGGHAVCTHRSAIRPVDGLMPSQVPSALTSRPESTQPRCLILSLTAELPSLEEEAGWDDNDNASNEWKCTGRVGRARLSSRFAHRMLPPPRSAGKSEDGLGGRKGTHSAYSGWVRDQKPTHMLPLGRMEWRIGIAGRNSRCRTC